MLLDKVKRYGITLKQVVTHPKFRNFLKMFRMFEVPEDLHAKLLLPFLSDKAKYVISRLCAGELEDYGAMRDFILAEFKLTPREYKTRFDSTVKRNEETFTLFAAHLRSSLRYYLKSCDCMDDFDRLFALLIADKLKSGLPEGALNYVLSLEGTDCFGPGKIAELADTYMSHHGEKDKSKCTAHIAQVKGSAEARSPRTDRQQGRFECPEDGGLSRRHPVM